MNQTRREKHTTKYLAPDATTIVVLPISFVTKVVPSPPNIDQIPIGMSRSAIAVSASIKSVVLLTVRNPQFYSSVVPYFNCGDHQSRPTRTKNGKSFNVAFLVFLDMHF